MSAAAFILYVLALAVCVVLTVGFGRLLDRFKNDDTDLPFVMIFVGIGYLVAIGLVLGFTVELIRGVNHG